MEVPNEVLVVRWSRSDVVNNGQITKIKPKTKQPPIMNKTNPLVMGIAAVSIAARS